MESPNLLRAPAPVAMYTHQMGVVFASFPDGSIWIQTGAERWAFVRKIAWGVPSAHDTPETEKEVPQGGETHA